LAIAENPKLLNLFVGKLRELLRSGQRISDVDRISAKTLEQKEAVLPRSYRAPPESPAPAGPRELVVRLSTGADIVPFTEAKDAVQEVVFERTGVVVPLLAVEQTDMLAPADFQLRIGDELLPPIHGFGLDKLWINASVDEVKDQLAKAEAHSHSGFGMHGSVVADDEQTRAYCSDRNVAFFDAPRFVSASVVNIVCAHAGKFLTESLLRHYIGELRLSSPELADVAETLVPPHSLIEALCSVLDAGISIHHLPAVLESLLIPSFEC
jgi:type III secretory pathway component EscV